ncbi:DUF4270 family protein [Spirosoma luteum]|uniref:DUF4270 family protein n=1 Tax=Spirosoma luteum TaxID=431553 RepID=UPI00035E3B91|nr:DUF4270 family protein [Spirosoma luteum]
MRTFWYAGLLLLTGIVLFSCQTGDLNVGQSVIKPQELLVQSVDSVTVKLSTVLRPDSFVTSSDPNLLVGRWTDPQTGKMNARSFAAVNYAANSLNTQTNIRLDSLVLELTYAFVYGDSTSQFNLSVHPLLRPMENQLYYNTSSLAYDPKAIVQKTFIPQPLSRTRQVRIRMPDALTQTFFTRLQNGTINDATTLADFLPGFALVCNSAANTFVGFATASSGLRFYYRTTEIEQTASTLLFPFSANYFSQLQNDRSGTVLSALKTRTDAVSSRQTGNTSFVMPGAELQTRIEFPYLNQFDRPEKFADLNKALLVISPVRKTLNDNMPLPPLALFFTNTQNDILPISFPGGVTGSSAAVTTYINDPNALTLMDSYTFDLTYYIGQIIKRKALNQPLLLTIPTSAEFQQISQRNYSLQDYVQRVVLGDQQKQNDQLKVQLFITSGT